jgi:hypothetical protein
MAITGRTATVAENSSTTSISGSLPSDRVTGDLVVAQFIMTFDATGTLTGPSGWTQLHTPVAFGSADPVTVATYYKFDNGSLTAPSASSGQTADRMTAIVQAYGGVHPTTPVDATAVTGGNNSTSITVGAYSTVTNGAMALYLFGADTATRTVVPPSGSTLVKAYSAAGTGRCGAMYQELRATAGSVGTKTWSVNPSAAVSMTGITVALRPGNVQNFTGSVTATGAFKKNVTKNPFTGSSTATGAATFLKVVVKVFTGSCTATGAFLKRANKVLTGTISTTATLRKTILKNPFIGSTTAVGTYSKKFIRLFTGSITSVGTLALTPLGRVFGRPGIARVVALKASEVIIRVRRS